MERLSENLGGWTPSCKGHVGLWPTAIKLNPLWKTEVSKSAWIKLCAGDSLCCNYALRSFCSTYAGDSFCSKYVGDHFYCNYTVGNLLQLWRWYFLLCIIHMTVSAVIMLWLCLLQLCRWQFQLATLHFFRWHPLFIKLKTFKGIISGLHFTTTFVNIPPKLRYLHVNWSGFELLKQNRFAKISVRSE